MSRNHRAPRTQVARQTGSRVTIAHADDIGLEHIPGFTVWYTVCEEHDECVGHPSQRLADSHAADPIGWCEECASSAAVCA